MSWLQSATNLGRLALDLPSYSSVCSTKAAFPAPGKRWLPTWCAFSLRIGTADADAILRRFTRSNVQHPTYQALGELGRVIKTLFLCEYLSDRRLRQEIQEALNVIEQWNSVNGFIFHGKGGELLSNRPEDQEIALLSLHLIQVSLALVNTLMLQEVLAEGKWKAAMKQEDWRGLTPLFYQHVNPYGRFTLDLTQRIPLSLTKLA